MKQHMAVSEIDRMRTKPHILIVDDEASMRLTLSMLLRQRGYSVKEASCIGDAIKELEREIFDIVITDLKLGDGDGMDLLNRVKKTHPDVEVVVITAYGTIESAVRAMKMGAFEYITKPFEPEEIPLIVEKALERTRLLKEVEYLRAQVEERFSFEKIIGKSSAIRHIIDMIKRVSKTDLTVLIEGESGTGKELVAKAIHNNSLRADKPFIAVNCGALPETLLESELFGHVKGAFTGAVANKKGLFEEAHQGTLFLDEVGLTSPSTQIKLLRVLQEGEIMPVGSTKTKGVDVRVLAASNRPLKDLVASGRFRDDLYFRLNVVTINIPPLRERKDDIYPLVEYFLNHHKKQLGKDINGLTEEALKALYNYSWPGNIRELKNAIDRAIVLAREDFIDIESLPPSITALEDTGLKTTEPSQTMGSIEGKATLKDMEKMLIIKTLKETSWNQARAAELLGIGRNTLWRKLKRYGIKVDDTRG